MIKKKLVIVYDKECFYCKNYIEFLELKKQFKNIELISARDSKNNFVKKLKKKYNLNKGFIAIYENKTYYAKDTLQLLGKISKKRTLLGKLHNFFFSKKYVVIILYPILKFFRSIYLILTRKKKIN